MRGSVGSPPPAYETPPPTSGAHVEPPYQQADGAYREEPAEIDYVHSLEHGRLEIQYAPDLPEADQLALKGLYDTMYGATLLFPNGKMPYAVAATTWTNLMGCPTYEGAATLGRGRADETPRPRAAKLAHYATHFSQPKMRLNFRAFSASRAIATSCVVVD